MAVKKIIFNDKDFEISYEILNHPKEKDFIILHGWGSNKEIMKGVFSSILPDFRHIYIDLPGFGKSTNEYILNSQDYQKIIDEFLQQLQSDKNIIMGHSFGGKIATLLKPELLILLSNSGILIPKKLSTRIKIWSFKLLKNFIKIDKIKTIFASKDVYNMSQNMYETFKNVVNEDFYDIFDKYDKKTLIFWGIDDKTTPLYSGEIVHKLIKNSDFYPLSGEHFFFSKHAKFIENKIQNTIKQGELS